MTCIVGYVYNDKVFIGADSAGVSGYSVRVRTDEKVFVKDDIVYGFTSSFRMGQIIRSHFKRPVHKEGMNDYDYLCSDYISSLINCFKDCGYLKKENEVVSGGVFLIGYNGKLYKVERDFQVGMVVDCYDSCGCGEEYALGALNILNQHEPESDNDVKNIIRESLETATKFSTGVRPPFIIKEV